MLSAEYTFRAVIRLLAGDRELFKEYQDKAIEAYEKETNICVVGEVIPRQVKKELYEMVR